MKRFFTKIKNLALSHKKTTAIVTTIVVLAISSGLYFYYANRAPLRFLSSLTDDQQIGIGRFIGNAYQHIYGYKTICKTADIILTKYPEAYRRVSDENLRMLNNILEKDDLNLEGAIYLFLPYENMQAVNNALYKELSEIAGGDETGIKSACILLEEQADLIVDGLTKDSAEEFNKILRSALE